MASTKDSLEIEILHNEWCRANGYPVRWVKRQASSDMLNAENSARFVKGAKRQATSGKLQAASYKR